MRSPHKSPLHHDRLVKTIGPYSYSALHQLGKGFSSTVYRGQDQLCRPVAIKVIPAQSLDSVRRAMMQNEVQCLWRCNSQHLLKCLDVYSTKNNHYIITEFCEGGDLSQLIQLSRLTPDQLPPLIDAIVSAYFQLHKLGFIHRDLKSSNILIKNGQVKLADFGFAQKIGFKGQTFNINVGTPVYMPPEAILKGEHSVKADIFAIGVIAYQLYFKKFPWNAGSERELAERMRKSKPWTQSKGKVPRRYLSLMDGCLQVQVQRRWELQELQTWLYDKELSRTKSQISLKST